MSYGLGVFGWGVDSVTPAASEEAPITLVTSRKILPSGKIEVDDDGNFAPMSDTHQRVFLLLQRCVFPPYIGLDFEAQVDAEVRSKLAVLTDGSNPTITLRGPTEDTPAIVVDTTVNTGRVKVYFVDNAYNTPDSVTI